MDGFQVMPMLEAARIGDIFITLTGGMKAVAREHIEVMKNGALIANSGHFNVEIEIEAKLGHIVDKETNERYRLPVKTECVLMENSRVGFWRGNKKNQYARGA